MRRPDANMALSQYQLKYFRERYEMRRRLNLCIQCGGEPPLEGKSYGANCKKRSDARYQRKKSEKCDSLPMRKSAAK